MRRAPQTDDEWAWFFCVERKKIEDKKGHVLNKRPMLQDDPFHNRDMAKNDKNSVYNMKSKN